MKGLKAKDNFSRKAANDARNRMKNIIEPQMDMDRHR